MASDAQLLMGSRSRQQPVGWDSRIPAGLGRPYNPWFGPPEYAPQLWPSPPGCNKQVEPETAGGNAHCETCDSRDVYSWAERLAKLLDSRRWCSPGVVGLMITQGEQGRSYLPAGPADPVAIGEDAKPHTAAPDSTNR
jgi:hypothetical protein